MDKSPITVTSYFSYHEFFGDEASEPELITRLSGFSVGAVMDFCLHANTNLKLWSRNDDENPVFERALARYLFPNILGDQICFDLRSDNQLKRSRALIHRKQILYLCKMAILHCSTTAKSVKQDRLGFGLLLLMVSDQFHLRSREALQSLSEEDQTYSLLAEFISINEFRVFDSGDRVIRAWRMLTVIPELMKSHHCYISFEQRFVALHGVELKTFLGMCFALLVGDCKEFHNRTGNSLTYGPDFWNDCALPADVIARFWTIVSASVPEVRSKLLATKTSSNDFTIFRQFPLLSIGDFRFGFDLTFIVEKLWAGVYWPILRSDDETARRLPIFLGDVFEAYVNDLLQKTCTGRNVFLANPRLKGNAHHQLCDGIIISGDAMVILEYKSSMLTVEAKYQNDGKKLRSEFEKKFVNPKGVGQLAAAIKILRSTTGGTLLEGISLSGIKQVFPVLVILESVGDSLLVSRVLNMAFERLCPTDNDHPIKVNKLSCIGISTLERVALILEERSLPTMLSEWFTEDPLHKGTFGPYALRGPRDTINNGRIKDFDLIANQLVEPLGLKGWTS